MDLQNPPSGTQVIGVGDAETLSIDDPGGVPGPVSEPTNVPIDAPVDPDHKDPFEEAFSDGTDTDTEETPGATDEIGGEGPQQPAPTPPTAPGETERPDWLPAEIDPTGLTDAELLRLRVVQQSAQAASQLPPQEAALLQRYRQASAGLEGQAATPAQPQVAPYQPHVLEVPEGYEGDVAIKTLVESLNRQNAENAYLVNTQAQQIATLGQAQQQTSQQASESSRVVAWQSFLAEHPEAQSPEVQQKIADQIAFWADANKQPGQFWAAALQNVLPKTASKAATASAAGKPTASAPMDPATKRARAGRAMAASAVHPPAQTLEPAKRTAALNELHENNADFGDFLRAEFPNG